MHEGSLLRSSTARIGLIVLLVIIAIASYVATRKPLETLKSEEREPAVVVKPVVAPAPAASVPPAAQPTTPVYTAPRETAPTASPIYRCREGSRTVYTQEPCANGRVVVTTSAVDGYDSRPSDGLQRVVTQGRARAPAAPTTPVYRTTRVTDGGVDDAKRAECATLRQLIADIDAQARLPNDIPALDRLRRIRQDTRDRMASLHC